MLKQIWLALRISLAMLLRAVLLGMMAVFGCVAMVMIGLICLMDDLRMKLGGVELA